MNAKKLEKSRYYLPKPLFDSLNEIEQQLKIYQKTRDLKIFKQQLSLFKFNNKSLKSALIDYKEVIAFLYIFWWVWECNLHA